MAYSDKRWDAVRVDYEVHSLSYNKLSKKHKIAKSTIITKSKKEDWTKGKTDQLISDKVIAKQEIIELDKKTDQLTTLEAKEVGKAVSFAMEMSGIYQDLEKEIANKTMSVAENIDAESPLSSMSVKNLAQTLQVLKDKDKPSTQINIQNNGDIAKKELKTMTLDELRDLRGTV